MKNSIKLLMGQYHSLLQSSRKSHENCITKKQNSHCVSSTLLSHWLW